MNLKEILSKASKEHRAIGHFNVANLEMLKAVVATAKDLAAPIMIGTSEGERQWLGLKNIVVLVKSAKEEWPNIFLNADHTKSVEAALEAINAGYDSIHFDGSALELNENIKQTREVVEYAHSVNPNISVEGELGYVEGDSQLSQKRIVLKPEDYTDPNQALEFVRSTGINRLAVAIGNIHGINLDEPQLDFGRLEKIKKIIPQDVALVLHAGSGIPDEDIKRAIAAGINNIHISTELRVAFRRGLEQNLKDNPTEYAPYRLYKKATEDIQSIVASKLKLFGSVDEI